MVVPKFPLPLDGGDLFKVNSTFWHVDFANVVIPWTALAEIRGQKFGFLN